MMKDPTEDQPRIDRMYSYALRIKSGEVGTFLYCMEGSRFYYYEGGYWQELFDIDFLARVQTKLPEICKFPVSKRKEIVENFKTMALKSLNGFNWTEMINLKNGMLSPYNGLLDDHSPDFFSTNRLPYEFKDGADCPLWIKTLNEIFENDQQRLWMLQEFFGYCLTRDTKQHKALLLLGESRSGKSTILTVLRNVIGEKNCSSVPLALLGDTQHTPDLINKLVNIDTDVCGRAQEFEAIFKTVTAGEPVRCNQKYVASFSFQPYCKIVMAANVFPRITDHSSAFYNRLILIPCDRVFDDKEQDRDLPVKLLSELSGILNWSMAGLKRLTDRGRFLKCEFMNQAVKELENENNPVNGFFDEFVAIEMGSSIEKGFLFDKYSSWANETKNYQLSKARFASCVFKRFGKNTPKNTRLPSGGKRIWSNIKYLSGSNNHSTVEMWKDK